LETIMSLRQKLQQLSPQQRSALADALYPDVAAKMKSPEEVDKIRKVGWHRVAPRLYLNVDRRGTRSWIFRYMHDGKSREMGLGSYPKVSLAVAHARVHELRQTFFDPVAVRHEAEKRKRAEEHVPGIAQWLPRSDRGTHERPENPARERKRLLRIAKREGIDPAELGIDPADADSA
jgi:Arm DNA-binding domain